MSLGDQYEITDSAERESFQVSCVYTQPIDIVGDSEKGAGICNGYTKVTEIVEALSRYYAVRI